MPMSRTSSKLKGLLAAVIELVQVRFQLLSIEAREEAMRLLGMIAFGAVALYLISMSLVFFAFGVIVHYWDTPHRMLTVVLVFLAFLVLGLIAGFMAYAKFRQGTQLFASSLQELRDDVERLQS